MTFKDLQSILMMIIFLKLPGYVNPTDVYTSILNYSNLKIQDITTLQAGSHIWIPLEKDPNKLGSLQIHGYSI